MDLEELSKHQVIMLALLVSFVTSIATGIVTVTLVDQAPTDVVRTIDRVVERTVETVKPGETKIIEKVKEVTPDEDELVIRAVNKNSESLVAVSNDLETWRQTGFFISKDGDIMTAATRIVPEQTYNIRLIGLNRGEEESPLFLARAVSVDDATNLAILRLIEPEDSDDENVLETNLEIVAEYLGEDFDQFPHLSSSSKQPSLGQKVIAMGSLGEFGTTVTIGIVSGVKEGNASTTPQLLTNIDYDSTVNGSPLFALDGSFVGVITRKSEEARSIGLPARMVSEAIIALEKEEKESNTASVIDGVGN